MIEKYLHCIIKRNVHATTISLIFMKVIGYVSHERLKSCYGKLLVMKILKRLNHKCLVFTFNNVFIANMVILIARKKKIIKM